MPRNFATFGPSELQPPFTGISSQSLNFFCYTCSTGQTSVSIHHFTTLQRPVVLLTSRCPWFCDSFYRLPYKSYSFSRSYGAILPSSFNTIHSSALIYSICSPVSVFSTVFKYISFFLKIIKNMYLNQKIQIIFIFCHLY